MIGSGSLDLYCWVLVGLLISCELIACFRVVKAMIRLVCIDDSEEKENKIVVN